MVVGVVADLDVCFKAFQCIHNVATACDEAEEVLDVEFCLDVKGKTDIC